MTEVERDPFVFGVFFEAKRGMQPGPPILRQDQARGVWLHARNCMLEAVQSLLELGVCKEQANRLLEPFMWQRVVITATDWENFFAQRCHPDAQQEMRVFADAVRRAIESSIPRLCTFGDWHTPYASVEEFPDPETRKAVSVGRCAGISYLKTDGSLDAALRVYQSMWNADPPHFSPFEHVATPAKGLKSAGNFYGWQQLREFVERDWRSNRHGSESVESQAQTRGYR